MLSSLHVSWSLCSFHPLFQVFYLYTYRKFCRLVILSFDYYLPISCSMLYNACMSSGRAMVLITAIWCNSFFEFLVFLLIKVYLLLFSNIIHSLNCHNYMIA